MKRSPMLVLSLVALLAACVSGPRPHPRQTPRKAVTRSHVTVRVINASAQRSQPAAPAPDPFAPVWAESATFAVEAKVVEPAPDPEADRRRLLFRRSSPLLSEQGRVALNDWVKWMQEDPARHIVIDVCAKDAAAPDYNVELARQRAQAAEDYFARMNVDASRIVVIPDGERLPTRADADHQRTLLVETRDR